MPVHCFYIGQLCHALLPVTPFLLALPKSEPAHLRSQVSLKPRAFKLQRTGTFPSFPAGPNSYVDPLFQISKTPHYPFTLFEHTLLSTPNDMRVKVLTQDFFPFPLAISLCKFLTFSRYLVLSPQSWEHMPQEYPSSLPGGLDHLETYSSTFVSPFFPIELDASIPTRYTSNPPPPTWPPDNKEVSPTPRY